MHMYVSPHDIAHTHTHTHTHTYLHAHTHTLSPAYRAASLLTVACVHRSHVLSEASDEAHPLYQSSLELMNVSSPLRYIHVGYTKITV